VTALRKLSLAFAFGAGLGLSSIGIQRLNNSVENHELRQQMAILRSSRMEFDHRWWSNLGDCSFEGDTYSCVAFTRPDDVPVKYHCDKDGCVVDCGGAK